MFSQVIRKVCWLLHWIIEKLREIPSMMSTTHKETAEETKESLMDFVNNVLIVDDKPEEIQGLKEALQAEDIGVDVLGPNDLESVKLRKKDLLFLDFMLDDSQQQFATIMSQYIRPLLEKHFNKGYAYGIVIWSKHEEHRTAFFERIEKDCFENKRYNAPLFVLSLDKLKYLNENNFSDVLGDVEQELEKSVSASFFINWEANVSKAVFTSISDMYGLAKDYENRDAELKRILYKMAENRIENCEDKKMMAHEALRAFDEILPSNLALQTRRCDDLFSDYQLSDADFCAQIKEDALINAKMFVDFEKLNHRFVLPGNIYELMQQDAYLEDNLPEGCRKIAIELTPPCDAAHKKRHSKLVGGFILPIGNGENAKKEWKNIIGKHKADYKYLLWPVCVEEENCLICFNFHCEKIVPDDELMNEQIFKLYCRAKNALFADVLQKYASNKARLGISNLIPKF